MDDQPPPLPPPLPPVPPPLPEPPLWKRVPTWVLAVSFVGWLATGGLPPGPLVMLHYLCLALLSAVLGYLLACRWLHPIAGLVAVASGLLVPVLHANYLDGYRSFEKQDDGGYALWYFRRNGSPWYVEYHSAMEKGCWTNEEGPMNSDWQRHGKWTFGRHEPGFKDVHDTWYYRDEVVTATDWQARTAD